MNGALVFFWIIAIVSVCTAVGVVLHPNPVRSAMFMIVNFMCLAVLYLLMNAQLLAMLQILVYAGAIMVLFVFVIMLLNLGGETAPREPEFGQKAAGIVLGLALLGGLIYGINYSTKHPALVNPDPRLAQPQLSQIQIIGWDLFTRYVYPFELTSVLLLVGLIGVVVLTKRRIAVVTAAQGES